MKASSVRFVAPLVLAACGASSEQPPPDIVGPYTGSVQRFVVDQVTLPTNSATTKQFAADLNGDGTVDNQAGSIAASLLSLGDGNVHAADMIASGVLASFFEIQADDLTTDDVVGVRYLGNAGVQGEQLGGSFDNGTFFSNRTRTTRHPVDTLLRLPIFADADPITARLVGTEIDLVPDGHGGYNGVIRGGVLATEALAAVTNGVIQMCEANPRDHLPLIGDIDKNRDGLITSEEVAQASLVRILLAPDIQLFQGNAYAPTPGSDKRDSLSLAFGFHLTPCPSGNCALAAPANTCFDRVLDATEPALDCGSTCALKCATNATCKDPGDCQSGGCDAGKCRAPTCADGVANGFESDVDCGGTCSTKCDLGKRCQGDPDCTSGICKGFLGGVCSTTR